VTLNNIGKVGHVIVPQVTAPPLLPPLPAAVLPAFGAVVPAVAVLPAVVPVVPAVGLLGGGCIVELLLLPHALTTPTSHNHRTFIFANSRFLAGGRVSKASLRSPTPICPARYDLQLRENKISSGHSL
jgi:hypothetical protein